MKTNELAKHYAEAKAKAERLSREAEDAVEAEKSARNNLEAVIYSILRSESGFDFDEGPGVVIIGDKAVAFNIDEEGDFTGLTVIDEIPVLGGKYGGEETIPSKMNDQ